MATLKELENMLENRALDERFAPLYQGEALDEAYSRARRMTEALRSAFGASDEAEAALVSAPGRTEIGGNHTDHQHGRVLCAGIDVDILAAAVKSGRNEIRVFSEGYPADVVDLGDLSPKKEEEGSSAAIVRGVAARIKEMGCELTGVDMCTTSQVKSGSGLSSSAAFEVMLGNVLNRMCCEDRLDPVEIAKTGQYAENVYFGKPCGLMDQMGSSLGGAVFIDFKDPEAPVSESIDASLGGYSLVIADTRSGHEDLTADYAAITVEMGEVARFFGKKYLREVDENEFYKALPDIRKACSDRAALRAMHFFEEDKRARDEAQALKNGDIEKFLELVNASGLSSELKLQNVWSPSSPSVQPVAVALAVGRRLLGGRGAIRVHGGGFAGTIQAFVPGDMLETFIVGMNALLGDDSCKATRIRPGGRVII